MAEYDDDAIRQELISENSALRARLATAENALTDNAQLRKALKPFSDMAGELFARNWNADRVVTALDNPYGVHRVTAGDYFAARLALVGTQ